MPIIVSAIGTLTQDPKGDETYTMYKVRAFGDDVTFFENQSAAQGRLEYRSGMRIRAEGRGYWKEFNEDWHLTARNAAVDGSDSEDQIKIKVDGRITHELQVEQDDEDEGGGRYIPVEIEATYRGKNSAGDWDDLIAYVRAMIIGPAVDKLLALDKQGHTNLCFSGDLKGTAVYVKDQPSFYAEIDDVQISQRGGGDDDSFWGSKPIGLAKRKSAPVKAAPRKAPPRGGGGGGDPDDPLPF